MKPIAYTYEADTHCIPCTVKRFAYFDHTGNVWAGGSLVKVDWYGVYLDQQDNEGNLVHPLFSTDEWQEIDGVTQYLACGDCHEIIDEYTH